jgi:hypothetical protein
MERAWVEVIVVMTVQNTGVTPRNLQKFPRNELVLSSELKIALNIGAVHSFRTSVNFYKTARCQISEDFFIHIGRSRADGLG